MTLTSTCRTDRRSQPLSPVVPDHTVRERRNDNFFLVNYQLIHCYEAAPIVRARRRNARIVRTATAMHDSAKRERRGTDVIFVERFHQACQHGIAHETRGIHSNLPLPSFRHNKKYHLLLAERVRSCGGGPSTTC